MSFASRSEGSIDRLVRHFGGGAEVTLRRAHSLVNPNTGAALNVLAVNGTVAAGGSSLDLDSTYL